MTSRSELLALIEEARSGADGCEDCVLLGRLADALEELLTPGLSLVPAEPAAVATRRPETKNMASPALQSAFIEGARQAMGAPSQEECEGYLGKFVEIVFNSDRPKVRGMLTRVIDHPARRESIFLVLDDDKDLMYPLNAIESVKVVP